MPAWLGRVGGEFDDVIELPDGRTLVTLHDAATYITELPKKEAAAPEWQTRSTCSGPSVRTGSS
jgi:hypothetical protein